MSRRRTLRPPSELDLADEPISPEIITRACALIERWSGVQLSGAAPRRLGGFLRHRAQHLDLSSAERYVELLGHASARDPEVRRLINLVTNGLTAFWRDAPQLDAVRLVFEQLATTRRLAADPIAVWCAGCATGEEAYTLAMLAAECGVSASVLGSDVNTDFLHAAREGVYHTWSLRRLAPERIERHFTEERPGVFAVSPRLKAQVSFSHHNLLATAPRSPRRGGWDVIVCRNVLIYFGPPVVRAVITSFAEGLQSDGYLMLGSSEQMDAYYRGERSPFRAARHGAGFVYRLTSKPPGSTVYKVPLRREAPAAVAAPTRPPRSAPSGPNAEAPSEQVINSLLSHGYALSGSDPERAMASFEAAASRDPFCLDAHYAMAMLLQERAPAQALEALRRIVFLEPLHWLAVERLAELHVTLGEPTRARQLYRQALEGIEANRELFELPATTLRFAPSEAERHQARDRCAHALSRL